MVFQVKVLSLFLLEMSFINITKPKFKRLRQNIYKSHKSEETAKLVVIRRKPGKSGHSSHPFLICFPHWVSECSLNAFNTVLLSVWTWLSCSSRNLETRNARYITAGYKRKHGFLNQCFTVSAVLNVNATLKLHWHSCVDRIVQCDVWDFSGPSKLRQLQGCNLLVWLPSNQAPLARGALPALGHDPRRSQDTTAIWGRFVRSSDLRAVQGYSTARDVPAARRAWRAESPSSPSPRARASSRRRPAQCAQAPRPWRHARDWPLQQDGRVPVPVGCPGDAGTQRSGSRRRPSRRHDRPLGGLAGRAASPQSSRRADGGGGAMSQRQVLQGRAEAGRCPN